MALGDEIMDAGAAPRLAFAIPTYRRARELDSMLQSLVPQAAEASLPIFISDNGSPYDTESVVRRHQASYDGICFERHATNMGFEANVIKALSMASAARYTWLLSDDDLVLNGAVASLLQHIERDGEAMALYVLNWERRDGDLEHVLLDRFIDMDVDSVLGDRELFYGFGLSALRFMSVLVFDNRLLGAAMERQAISSQQTAKNWGFVYQRLALEVAAGRMSKVVAAPHLAQRIGRPFYEGRDCEVFLLDFPRMILSVPDMQYSAKEKRAVLRQRAPFEPKFVPTLITALARSKVGRRHLIQMVDTYVRLGLVDRAAVSAALLICPHRGLRVARRAWQACLGVKKRLIGGEFVRGIAGETPGA